MTTLTLTPTVNEPNATAVVNNGNPIALAVGANPILVEVTAQDGTTKITYTVTVTRAAALQAVIAGPTTPVSGAFSVVITFSQPVTPIYHSRCYGGKWNRDTDDWQRNNVYAYGVPHLGIKCLDFATGGGGFRRRGDSEYRF